MALNIPPPPLSSPIVFHPPIGCKRWNAFLAWGRTLVIFPLLSPYTPFPWHMGGSGLCLPSRAFFSQPPMRALLSPPPLVPAWNAAIFFSWHSPRLEQRGFSFFFSRTLTTGGLDFSELLDGAGLGFLYSIPVGFGKRLPLSLHATFFPAKQISVRIHSPFRS